MGLTNYIFVDYENVREIDLDLIKDKPVKVVLVLGEKHNRLETDLVEKLLTLPREQVGLERVGRSGRNALDFVLAYLIGVQSMRDPEGHFHILSKDKGYDALIQHLKGKDIFADRHDTFARIPFLARKTAGSISKPGPARKRPAATDLAALAAETIAWFKNNPRNCPRTRKRLQAHLYSYFRQQLSEAQLEAIIQHLVSQQAIEIAGSGKVTYKL